MAHAETLTAPLKTELIDVLGHKVKKDSLEYDILTTEYDRNKKYVFTLASRTTPKRFPTFNMRTHRPEPHKDFKPFQNLVMSSQIVWNGSRVNIRYYDGCESIFQSHQPKEKDVIDQLKQQTKRRNFLEGKLIVDGYDTLLLMYLNICSWNVESPFRTNTATGIFLPENSDRKADADTRRMDLMDEALALAKSADYNKMIMHSNYLGISMIDYHSGNAKTEKEIRVAYRDRALNDAANFISSYGDRSIELKYYIDKALLDGKINNKVNPNKAAWGNSNNPICDISGLKSNEAIGQKLYEFSQLEEGQEFAVQLKAIYNSK